MYHQPHPLHLLGFWIMLFCFPNLIMSIQNATRERCFKDTKGIFFIHVELNVGNIFRSNCYVPFRLGTFVAGHLPSLCLFPFNPHYQITQIFINANQFHTDKNVFNYFSLHSFLVHEYEYILHICIMANLEKR